MDDLIEAAREGNPNISQFDSSCFTGKYVTGDISDDYLEHVSSLRNDAAKQARDVGEDMLMDLSNNHN